MLTNVHNLKDRMVKMDHPGLPIVQAALDCSDNPEFIETLARALSHNAKLDREIEDERRASLLESR